MTATYVPKANSFLLKIFIFIHAIFFARLSHAATNVQDLELEQQGPKTGQYELMLISSYKTTYGKYNPYGAYQAMPAGSSAANWMNVFAVNSRFSREWEGSLSISAVNSEGNYSSGQIETSSIGSPQVQLRRHYTIPDYAHVVLQGGLSAPYKYSHSSVAGNPSEDSLNDDIDGPANTWAGKLGAVVSHEFKEQKLRVSVSADYTYAMPQDVDQPGGPDNAPRVSVQKGQQRMLGENLSYSLSDLWSTSVGFRQVWVNDTTADGNDVPNTSARLLTTTLGFTYKVSTWRFSGNYSTPYPFYSNEVNQAYAPTYSMSILYNGI